MSRVFLSNFDFEHNLAGVRRKHAANIASDLAAAWLAIAQPTDCIHAFAGDSADRTEFEAQLNAIGRTVPRGELSSCDSLVPWGWDAPARAFATQRKLRISGPPLDVVQTVNARGFSFALEQQFGCDLSGSAAIRTLSEFQQVVASLQKWVVKAEFSMSSRERIMGRGVPTEPQLGWVANRLAEGGSLFVEPWVEILDERGFQFEIHTAGEVELLGVTGLLTTQSGGFAGCQITGEPALVSDTANTLQRVAEAIATTGYCGPLGIDAARYRDSGEIRTRPVQDVNARFTMGRLALGYRDVLAKDEQACWLFLPCARGTSFERLCGQLQPQLPGSVRLVRTSPLVTQNRATRLGTVLLISSDLEALQAGFMSAFGLCQGSHHA